MLACVILSYLEVVESISATSILLPLFIND
jgi:hypothetical protein